MGEVTEPNPGGVRRAVSSRRRSASSRRLSLGPARGSGSVLPEFVQRWPCQVWSAVNADDAAGGHVGAARQPHGSTTATTATVTGGDSSQAQKRVIGCPGVQSVDRAITVLELIAEHGEAGVGELAAALAVHHSTALRLLGVLVEHGLVEQVGDRGSYFPLKK